MNKLEKGKLQEIDHALYQLNTYIGMTYISKQKQVTLEEWLKISGEIARCIRQLRNLQ